MKYKTKISDIPHSVCLKFMFSFVVQGRRMAPSARAKLSLIDHCVNELCCATSAVKLSMCLNTVEASII